MQTDFKIGNWKFLHMQNFIEDNVGEWLVSFVQP